MALDDVQNELFVHTVDLYRPVDRPAGVGTTAAPGNRRFVRTPAYSSVPCYVQFTAEFGQPESAGRTKTVNFETLDVLHVQLSQELEDGWVFQFTTSGHPDAGGWWNVLGNAKDLDLANTREFFTRRSVSPPLLTN